MDITTSWLKPPLAIGGLDHLAVQAPCINLYGRMLPGITNVTDRARYYSFYPWIIWALEKRGLHYGDEFIDLFRKADCLFTLIAARHTNTWGGDPDDHMTGTIGTQNMAEAITKIRSNESVTLSVHAAREGTKRYFKNKLGGLGQYYLGVMRELSIMTGDQREGIKNIKEIGGSIAESFDLNVDGELFLRTLDEDTVSTEQLDQLDSFCPCKLKASVSEHTKLLELFFVNGQFFDQNALARRHTLSTILLLADRLAEMNINITLEQFRGCTYSGYLPDQTVLQLPDPLEANRQQWAVYQRNEILSVAIQGIFFVVLDAYGESGERFHSVAELVSWFFGQPEIQQLASFSALNNSMASLINSAPSWLRGLSDWQNTDHEVQLVAKIERLCSKPKSLDNRAVILLASIKVLIALNCRQETRQGYGSFVFSEGYFDAYPINLRDFHRNSGIWTSLNFQEWIAWLIGHWGINTHLMVAMRKLHSQSQSTFRIRPSDQGLEVISVPPAVFTQPRFKQALRILIDIGALTRERGVWKASEIGRQLLEAAHD